MKCPTCTRVMTLRNSINGEFYFCPDQHICGQKTITKKEPPSFDIYGNVEIPKSRTNTLKEAILQSNDPLVLEMRALEAEQSILFKDINEPWLNEVGDLEDIDGNPWVDEDRPY